MTTPADECCEGCLEPLSQETGVWLYDGMELCTACLRFFIEQMDLQRAGAEGAEAFPRRT